jgi:hypothetical protein
VPAGIHVAVWETVPVPARWWLVGVGLFPHYYWQCTRSNRVLENIPLAHVSWAAGWLSRLSQEQIADAFRAAFYMPEEVALSTAVHQRNVALNGLTTSVTRRSSDLKDSAALQR